VCWRCTWVAAPESGTQAARRPGIPARALLKVQTYLDFGAQINCICDHTYPVTITPVVLVALAIMTHCVTFTPIYAPLVRLYTYGLARAQAIAQAPQHDTRGGHAGPRRNIASSSFASWLSRKASNSEYTSAASGRREGSCAQQRASSELMAAGQCSGRAGLIIYKRLSSVQQEAFTHRHDRHQTSVNKAVARVVEVRWPNNNNNNNRSPCRWPR
jgi:hypothetical protein